MRMTIQCGYRYKIREMSIIHFYLFFLVFVSFLSSAVSQLPSKTKTEYFVTKSYDSEFLPFMKKMYSDMPGLDKIKQEMKGPNIGYRPYWYAYNYALHGMPEQKDPKWDASSHEDWDYGLGQGSFLAGKSLWGGGNLSLMAGSPDEVLGAAELLDQDLESSSEKLKCYPNLGSTCKLGRGTKDYSAKEIAQILRRTRWCDHCSYENRWLGDVCTVDKTGMTQAMDACVMEKMNCMGGVAYVAGMEWRHQAKWQKVPFALKPHWGRFAVRGPKDAEIRLFHVAPYWYALYWIILAGYPYSGPISAIFPDSEDPYNTPAVWWKRDPYWGYSMNNRHYTEYTIVWNSQNGWFLMSQPRYQNWQSRFYMEYVDPIHRDFKYIDVAPGWTGAWVEFMLFDLTKLYNGQCVYEAPHKEEVPSGTVEMVKEVQTAQKTYQDRYNNMEARGLDLKALSGQQGSYQEYQ